MLAPFSTNPINAQVRANALGVPVCAPVLSSAQAARFAVIGDYGYVGANEEDVANMVKLWNPDFIITTGDNNYDSGSAETIDSNIGQYYSDYIYPYTGNFTPTVSITQNLFFPSLGNHDWDTLSATAYITYFTLPGNERYYDFVSGPVHFFALDSDTREPSGVTITSTQATWLNTQLATSTSKWNLVYMHHAPYSSPGSGRHGNSSWMQWPYRAWGVTAVLAGHDHDYERILKDGFPYFVNGVGGKSLYPFEMTYESGSAFRFAANYGAMLVTADDAQIKFEFFAITDTVTALDAYTVTTSSSINRSYLPLCTK